MKPSGRMRRLGWWQGKPGIRWAVLTKIFSCITKMWTGRIGRTVFKSAFWLILKLPSSIWAEALRKMFFRAVCNTIPRNCIFIASIMASKASFFREHFARFAVRFVCYFRFLECRFQRTQEIAWSSILPYFFLPWDFFLFPKSKILFCLSA